jgi:serine/threonine protein kinase
VLDAICHLHTKDIVFRDLKPENIMVDYDGFPKLIDLGFAKKLNHSRTFTICGTP